MESLKSVAWMGGPRGPGALSSGSDSPRPSRFRFLKHGEAPKICFSYSPPRFLALKAFHICTQMEV